MATEQKIVALYEDEDAERLNAEQHARILKDVLDWFETADRRRQPHVREWRRQYLMYRSFVSPRAEGDWQSRIFIPVSFHVIESQMPKLIAQLPQPIVMPVGPEDVEPASKMEERLKWAFDQSGLFVQLVASTRSALKYGTGVIKVYPGKRTAWKPTQVPRFTTEQVEVTEQPAADELQIPDLNGQPLGVAGTRTEERQVPELDEAGNPVFDTVREEVTLYQGPITEAIDIEHFWPAPEATSIEDARWVFHEVWRDEPDVMAKFEDGTYKLAEGSSLGGLWEQEENAAAEREGELGLSSELDMNRRAVRIWEIWTNDMQITVLNQRLVVRVAPNPMAHGMKPFVRIVDNFQEHEFWGTGELEAILGLQDAINALWNTRIDNVRLAIQRVFAVNPHHLYDQRDLRFRPGSTIRIKSNIGLSPKDLIYPIDIPDVTGSAYEEVNEMLGMVERVTAVANASDDSASAWNDTATGVALTTESLNDRFGLKVRMAELTGLIPLSRMFGALLQQFGEPEIFIRREGAEGGWEFETDPMTGEPVPDTAQSIMGSFDFDIETASATQTETFRKQQELTLYDILSGRADAMGVPIMNDRELTKDLLKVFGKKDVDRLMLAPQLPGVPMGGDPMMGGMGLGMAPPPSVEETAEAGVGYPQ